MDVLIATVAERPDLASLLDDFNDWPTFMRQDPIGALYYADPVAAYPEFVLVAVDRAEPDRLVREGRREAFRSGDGPAGGRPGGDAPRRRLGRGDHRRHPRSTGWPPREPRVRARDLDPAGRPRRRVVRGDARRDVRQGP